MKEWHKGLEGGGGGNEEEEEEDEEEEEAVCTRESRRRKGGGGWRVQGVENARGIVVKSWLCQHISRLGAQ